VQPAGIVATEPYAATVRYSACCTERAFRARTAEGEEGERIWTEQKQVVYVRAGLRWPQTTAF
jgi:hypothetical protein